MPAKTMEKMMIGVNTKATRSFLVLQIRIRCYCTTHGVLVKMVSVLTYTAGRYFKMVRKNIFKKIWFTLKQEG